MHPDAGKRLSVGVCFAALASLVLIDNFAGVNADIPPSPETCCEPGKKLKAVVDFFQQDAVSFGDGPRWELPGTERKSG